MRVPLSLSKDNWYRMYMNKNNTLKVKTRKENKKYVWRRANINIKYSSESNIVYYDWFNIYLRHNM